MHDLFGQEPGFICRPLQLGYLAGLPIPFLGKNHPQERFGSSTICEGRRILCVKNSRRLRSRETRARLMLLGANLWRGPSCPDIISAAKPLACLLQRAGTSFSIKTGVA